MPNDLDVSASFALGMQQLMCRYQQADRTAVPILIEALSPQLYRFFASQTDITADADEMLHDLWLRIHRARHSYGLGARASVGVCDRAPRADGQLSPTAPHGIARNKRRRFA